MMNNFIYENKTKVYFGKGGVKEYLCCLLKNVGDTVMLAYGGGSIKKNGVYDEVTAILQKAGKTVVEFTGIMSNPTYAKVQEGAELARENNVDFILVVGGGSVIDCCKIVSVQAKLDEDIWEMETDEETALAGVEALADFIKEIGLPTAFTEMGISKDTDFRAVADSTNITAGCCKKLTHDEIYEILKECI